MAIDADELPREGLGTQQFIEDMSVRVGANNILDVIMRNPIGIAKKFGAKPPAYHPPHGELNIFKPKVEVTVSQPDGVNNDVKQNMPPNPDDMPDVPRGLHTPKARMMPGADTEPGKPISADDAAAFSRTMSEMKTQVRSSNPYANTSPWGLPPFQFGGQPTVATAQPPRPSFFKDGLGNEYKVVGNSLYVLGWQDANIKIRLVNEASGKEVPTKGRKFQIYGWHLVQKVDEFKSTDADDVSRIEKETTVDDVAVEGSRPKQRPQVVVKDTQPTEPTVDYCGVDAAVTAGENAKKDVQYTVEVAPKTPDDGGTKETVASTDSEVAADGVSDKKSSLKKKKRLI